MNWKKFGEACLAAIFMAVSFGSTAYIWNEVMGDALRYATIMTSLR